MTEDGDRVTPEGNSGDRWLGMTLTGRTVAELSIWFCITASGSLIAMALFVVAVLGACDAQQFLGEGFLVGLGLWLVFLIWLWISFVRIARHWGPERLGTEIFTRLQRGFLVLVVLIAFSLRLDFGGATGAGMMLVVFDVVILEMVIVFLLLAWLARCKIPWQTYWDIAVIMAVFALQVVLLC